MPEILNNNPEETGGSSNYADAMADAPAFDKEVAMAAYEADHPEAVRDIEKARAMAEAGDQSRRNAIAFKRDADRLMRERGETIYHDGDFVSAYDDLAEYSVSGTDALDQAKYEDRFAESAEATAGSLYDALRQPHRGFLMEERLREEGMVGVSEKETVFQRAQKMLNRILNGRFFAEQNIKNLNEPTISEGYIEYDATRRDPNLPLSRLQKAKNTAMENVAEKIKSNSPLSAEDIMSLADPLGTDEMVRSAGEYLSGIGLSEGTNFDVRMPSVLYTLDGEPRYTPLAISFVNDEGGITRIEYSRELHFDHSSGRMVPNSNADGLGRFCSYKGGEEIAVNHENPGRESDERRDEIVEIDTYLDTYTTFPTP